MYVYAAKDSVCLIPRLRMTPQAHHSTHRRPETGYTHNRIEVPLLPQDILLPRPVWIWVYVEIFWEENFGKALKSGRRDGRLKRGRFRGLYAVGKSVGEPAALSTLPRP